MSDDALPKGLLEEVFLTRLLHLFITKLEGSHSRLSVKISKKTTPELFDFDQHDVDYLWMLIESLDTDHHVLTINPSRQMTSKEIYDGAILVFNPDKEALVRAWLKRPICVSEIEQWQKALVDYVDRFTPQQIGFLKENRLKHNNKTATEVLDSIGFVNDELSASTVPLSCRTLSARCFDGDSKFLDRRENLLRQLFPESDEKLKTRPILLSIAIPAIIQSVLFIENQETFLECVEQHNNALIANTALVYSAGFRGAADRVRNKGGIVFAFVNASNSSSRGDFEKWWHDDDQIWPCYFWGDLDYDGMRILSTLRNLFTSIQAWQPGYKAMLNYHKKGIGHAPAAAKKERQKPLDKTGCEFADSILLPILHNTQKFLDQEVISNLNDDCIESNSIKVK
jgi:hypothetical protein